MITFPKLEIKTQIQKKKKIPKAMFFWEEGLEGEGEEEIERIRE